MNMDLVIYYIGSPERKGGYTRPRAEHVWAILGANRYGDPKGYCAFENYDDTRPFVVLSVLSPQLPI